MGDLFIFNQCDFMFFKDSRNFLKSPPSGVDFHFDFDVAYPIAMAILEEDPALHDMRFKLVPKQ